MALVRLFSGGLRVLGRAAMDPESGPPDHVRAILALLAAQMTVAAPRHAKMVGLSGSLWGAGLRLCRLRSVVCNLNGLVISLEPCPVTKEDDFLQVIGLDLPPALGRPGL